VDKPTKPIELPKYDYFSSDWKKSPNNGPSNLLAIIADRDNHCIRVLDLVDCNVSTLAGMPSISGRGNGELHSATFKSPTSAVPFGGAIFVSENGKASMSREIRL
jgi:hypothetical protein